MITKHSGNRKDILILLAAVAAVFISGIILEKLLGELPQSIRPLESDIEILSELFPVFVSLSIFAMTWFAYGKSRDKHSLFLGSVFLLIGLLDLFHLLSQPFLPDFITANSFQKTGIFNSESRLLLAILLLASSYIYREKNPKFIDRSFLFLYAMTLFILSVVPVLYSPDSFPVLYQNDGFPIALMIRILLTTLLIMFTCYRYARRIQETGEKHLEFVIYGLIFMISSDLVYYNHELPGHLLILSAFFCIYMALYKSSVELPYEKLAEAEDKLRMAAEEKYKNLFDNASDAIITVDLENRITSWNQAAENIFGWKAQEVIGEKLSKILVQQFGHAKMEKIIKSVISGIPISGVDVVCPHKNGTTVDVSLSVSPLRDANQNMVGLSGILRDITERKRSEKIYMENQRLVYASKAKSDFLANMSHELRTPLNS
ncbi:MAG: PAS domain S-box protein, partial [Candidatus Methanoperedens sp.]|nr:PAS domain S-box protein [Candidatus Methanoperedens sp.]